jgi:hypothetical protein
MPRKPKLEKQPTEVLAPIPAAILNQIVTAEEIETASRRFKKALIERALGGELTHHLGYPPGAAEPELATNHRNGISGTTVLTDDGPVAIEVPRDRQGTFEPQLIGKHERRFTGFDGQVIALYARGLTVREIQAFLKETHAVDVSPDPISTVTDAVVAGCDGVATSTARAVLSRRVFRCPAREDSRRSDGAHQSGLSRVGGVAGRQPRHSRHLDRADGGRPNSG